MALRSFRYARPTVCLCNRLHNSISSDAASQTSRFEAMTVDPISELPTHIEPYPAASANPFDSPDDPPIPSLSGERPDSESDVAAALAAISRLRLDTSQRETLITSLNTSSDVTSSPRALIPVPQHGISASDILAAQTTMSRLNGEQKSKLAKELSNLGASSSEI